MIRGNTISDEEWARRRALLRPLIRAGLTPFEAAERLGVSHYAVRGWARRWRMHWPRRI